MGYSTQKLKEFAKGSSILVVSNIILKAIQFFLLPIYTKYLSPKELGISDSITSFTTFLFPLLVMAFDSAFSAFYYEERENQHQKVFNTCFAFLSIQSMIPILLTLVSGKISQILFETPIYSMGVKLALLSVSVNLLFLPFSLLIRMQNRMQIFAIINVISSLTMISLNVVFVSVLQWGYIALMASTFIVNILQIILYVITCKMTIAKSYVEKSLFKDMIRYALPFIPMTVSTWVLNMSDRYMLLFLAGESEVGIYGIGGRFVTVISVVISGISTAYTAFAFQSVKDENAKEIFSDVVNIIFVFLAGVCTTVSLFGKEVIQIMTSSEYHDAYYFLASLMFSQLAYALYTFTGYGISFKKQSKYFFYSVTLGAAINVLLNFIFIPQLGAKGAALTTLVGMLTMFLTAYYFAQKLYPCQYGVKKICIIFIGLYACCVVFMQTNVIYKCIIWLIAATSVLAIYRNTLKKVFFMFKNR
ncbi:flippase [Faecalicatena contorta]|uniref:flippase n=1 Tax=Faecalicatena contorta TaxID=39482 RepID=UPI001F268585|nr:flippase [Faecalicatena contorta]MCF2680718.1 flippase [Faecalicatena contorta]